MSRQCHAHPDYQRSSALIILLIVTILIVIVIISEAVVMVPPVAITLNIPMVMSRVPPSSVLLLLAPRLFSFRCDGSWQPSDRRCDTVDVTRCHMHVDFTYVHRGVSGSLSPRYPRRSSSRQIYDLGNSSPDFGALHRVSLPPGSDLVAASKRSLARSLQVIPGQGIP